MSMRVAITLRLEADLLEAARAEAKRDSRTLTNLIEVALKRHLAGAGLDRSIPPPGQSTSREPQTSAASQAAKAPRSRP